MGLYVLATLLYLGGFAFQRGSWLGPATVAACLGFGSHTAALALRWAATGHPPVMRDYENAVAGAWWVVALFLGLQLRWAYLRPLGAAIAPFALLMLGYAALNPSAGETLTPALQSPWLLVHVLFAWLAYGSYAAASGLAALFLVRGRLRALASLPAPEILDEQGHRLIAFGFVSQIVMMATGAIYASRLWGAYWSWDPVQIWTLLSWLIYAIYLHLRATYRWRGRKAAWLALGALLGVIVSFWGVNWVRMGLHVFNLM